MLRIFQGIRVSCLLRNCSISIKVRNIPCQKHHDLIYNLPPLALIHLCKVVSNYRNPNQGVIFDP